MLTQVCPPSLVLNSRVQGGVGQGAVPSTQPVRSDTNVTDAALKVAGRLLLSVPEEAVVLWGTVVDVFVVEVVDVVDGGSALGLPDTQEANNREPKMTVAHAVSCSRVRFVEPIETMMLPGPL